MQKNQDTKTFEIYSSKYSKQLSRPYHLSTTYPPTIFDTFQIPKLIQRREDVFSRKATNHTSKGGTLTHSRLLLLSNYNKFNSESFHLYKECNFIMRSLPFILCNLSHDFVLGRASATVISQELPFVQRQYVMIMLISQP